jgi:hypothetical protein
MMASTGQPTRSTRKGTCFWMRAYKKEGKYSTFARRMGRDGNGTPYFQERERVRVGKAGGGLLNYES